MQCLLWKWVKDVGGKSRKKRDASFRGRFTTALCASVTDEGSYSQLHIKPEHLWNDLGRKGFETRNTAYKIPDHKY